MAPLVDVASAVEVCRAAAAGAPLDVVAALASEALRSLVPARAALWADVDVDGVGPATVLSGTGPPDDALHVPDDALHLYAGHVASHPEVAGSGPQPGGHCPHRLRDAHQLCLVLPAPPGRRLGLALHRSSPFTSAERTRVGAVVPLIACSVLAARMAPGAAGDLLTARESAVLRAVATGMSDKQAARLLGVSPRTVGKHLEHIYAKLGVAGRTEAAAQVWPR